MASVNKAVLVGNPGRDPEVLTFQGGGGIRNLSVATSSRWKDRATGESRERTEWHRVAIFSEPLFSVAENYLRKGSPVYLEGRLETRKWTDRDGKERYSTEFVLRPYRGELQLLGRRGDSPQSPGDDDSRFGPPPDDDTAHAGDLVGEIPF